MRRNDMGFGGPFSKSSSPGSGTPSSCDIAAAMPWSASQLGAAPISKEAVGRVEPAPLLCEFPLPILVKKSMKDLALVDARGRRWTRVDCTIPRGVDRRLPSRWHGRDWCVARIVRVAEKNALNKTKCPQRRSSTWTMPRWRNWRRNSRQVRRVSRRNTASSSPCETSPATAPTRPCCWAYATAQPSTGTRSPIALARGRTLLPSRL